VGVKPGDLDSTINESYASDFDEELGLLGRHPDVVVMRMADKLAEQRDHIRALREASRAVLERINEVYRPEYVQKAAAREPDSLLGRCARLAGICD
jgi:hypothetical protein